MPRVTFGPYSVEVPSQWTLSSVILSGPPDLPQGNEGEDDGPSFQRNFITTMEALDDDTTVQEYVLKQRQGLIAADVKWRLIVEEAVEVNGLEGNLSEQLLLGMDEVMVQQMQLAVVKERVAFTSIVSHLAGLPFESCRDEFREMLLSFE